MIPTIDKLHYNFVYFNANCNSKKIDPDEYNAICLRDAENLDGVKVIQGPLQEKSFFLRSLYNLHHSPRIKRRIKLPFKSIWFPFVFKDDFQNSNPYCFVFASASYSMQYVRYLRAHYPGCKVVKLHRDLLKVAHANPEYSEENMNSYFDLRLTFDDNEAKEFGLSHFDEIESEIEIEHFPEYPLSDVFFAGKAKDRLPKLIEAYDLFTSCGLNCDFFITHVKPDEQIHRDGITYSNSFMPYKEMLYKSVNTRFMFDINQTGAVGYTSRFLEAVIYNKLFITDNAAVKNTKYYLSGNILYYNNVSDIDVNFFKKEAVDYKYQGDFSPVHLIAQIDRELTCKN